MIKCILFITILACGSLCKLDHCKGSEDFYKVLDGIKTFKDFKSSLNKNNFLGGGLAGKVYELKMNGRPVAVKMIKLLKEEFEDGLIDYELDVLQIIEKAKISPKVIDCYESGKNVYIIQEKFYNDLSSPEFSNYFSKLDFKGKIGVFIKIAKAVSKLHEFKIIHEDLKPENIMAADPDFNDLKLIDFGVARKTEDQIVGGTNYFSNADKINGSPFATYYDDVYALAITFMVLLKGDPEVSTLLDSIECHKIFDQLCTNQLQFNLAVLLSEIHEPEFTAIILKSTLKALNEYQNVEEMITDLESLERQLGEKLSKENSKHVENEGVQQEDLRASEGSRSQLDITNRKGNILSRDSAMKIKEAKNDDNDDDYDDEVDDDENEDEDEDEDDEDDEDEDNDENDEDDEDDEDDENDTRENSNKSLHKSLMKSQIRDFTLSGEKNGKHSISAQLQNTSQNIKTKRII